MKKLSIFGTLLFAFICFIVAPMSCNPDIDGDGTPDSQDNCPTVYNPTQVDNDGDLIGNECDNCPEVSNPDQKDTDGDKVGDACEGKYYYLYFTTAQYTGDLGGRSGADAKCAAEVSNKPTGCGTGWAFMSITSNDRIMDFPTTKGVITTLPWYFAKAGSSVQASTNWADLLDGSVMNNPYSLGYSLMYWAGATSSGDLSSQNCMNWTSGSSSYGGAHGYIYSGFPAACGWISNCGATCQNVVSLICACAGE